MDRASVAAVAALDDDLRRALYLFVRRAGGPVTRESAAAAVGISRNLAAFHLDKLVEVGLLASRFGERSRPVGRAPRVYEPAAVEVEVRLPDRSPELLADILIAAVLAEDDGEDARAAAIRIAGERGRSLGAEARQGLRGRLGAERALSATADVLAAAGYEPYACPGPGLRLGNCPFHPLAQREPALVCGLNHAYLAGFLDELGAGDRLDAQLAPRPGECCVEVRPR